MKVILLGAPGAGKGTQASRVAECLRVPKAASGELFRDHQKRDTELGRLAKSYMERGVLVPDSVTIDMVSEWINANDGGGGFLLDGFPRTLGQAEALDGVLAGNGGIDKALYIRVSQEELVRRLSGRLICRGCQTPYNRESAPPEQPGRCDLCGAELYQRDDDKPKAVGKRLQVYFEETEPLVDYYCRASVLQEIDGEGSVAEVGKALLATLGC